MSSLDSFVGTSSPSGPSSLDSFASGEQAQTAQAPKQSLSDQIWGGLANGVKGFGSVTGANSIGESLGTAGFDVGQMAQGKNPFANPTKVGGVPQPGTNPASQVDIPKTIGGYLQAGSTIGAAGLPIATAPTAIARVGQATAGYGALGGITGAGSALENKATPGSVLASSATGAVIGAAGGAIGQGIGEGVSALKAAKSIPGSLKDTIDVISPKPTPIAGAKDIAAGKGTAPSLLSKGGIDQSETPYIQKAANDVQGLVSSKNSMIENVNNVHNGITNLSENVVKPFLTENKVPFNFEDLQKSLDLVKPSSSLASDPAAFSTYDRVKNEIQQTLYSSLKSNSGRENLTDMNNLWDARKSIDSKINQELGNATFGSPQYTGVKAAARDIRNSVNEFISNSIANPGQMEQVNKMQDFIQTARSRGIDISSEEEAMDVLKQQFGLKNLDENNIKAAFFRDSLSKMSGMYDAISNMAPKAYGEVGKTGINLLMKKHPLVKKLVGAGLTGVGLGLGFKGIESL